ncbi:uncharacterized protein LOC117583962 isoform X1 [Drosophila guanche]|uniref:BED-type domain-containing protein n=1 Tax=Drosophila guanche TaxID=7266 RepID=A0A3B0JRL5_DROGU|nr:uncharacterized protein LOC117583962 isoform X1 [Drosophila guanche]SPP75331.1 Hypothetical predicted protein [Drosophila guanche]
MPKGRVSNVWQHYDINEDCENFAICRYCGNNISRGGMASNLKGNNTTNLWTHLRHKHSDEVIVNPVQSRQGRIIPIIKKEKTVRITKAKQLREPLHVAKPKIERQSTSYVGEAGALPQKWEEYEQNDEISEDIKDIIYSEDPLCYSPIHVMEEEVALESGAKVTVLNPSVQTRSTISAAPVVATVVASNTNTVNAAKQLKNNLETSIDRLTTVSEQLSYIIQQNHEEHSKDDDYYFALSLVPSMRQMSLSRKLYVRTKIQEVIFKASEESGSAKDE